MKSFENVNGPNAPIKRHRVAEWIKYRTYLQEAYYRSKTYMHPPQMHVDVWQNQYNIVK